MQGTKHISISRINKNSASTTEDIVIEEAPLQILIGYGDAANRETEPLSVTMRTPGDDLHLVYGFLSNEGIIQNTADLTDIIQTDENTVLAILAPHVPFDASKQKRHFITSSACGFCGRTDVTAMPQQPQNSPGIFQVSASLLVQLPSKLNKAQRLFAATGGAHAVALFDENGQLVHLAEDVGRHNAMDKLVGFMLRQNALPISRHLLLFSGRLGYELVQKATVAGIPLICSIGAPTSLAIDTARQNNIAIAGFLKENSFNVYCGAEAIITA